MIRFQRLQLRGYRRFHEFNCEFGAGLNIITGSNESGKSTLLGALLDALYANPFSTAQELRERVRWGHTSGWELELELLNGEQTISIRKCYFLEDPTRGSTCIIRDNEKAREGKDALRFWEELWGVPREVYLATACIRQRELSAIATDKKSLASLQQQLHENALMTDLERILKQLQEQVNKFEKQCETVRQQRQALIAQLQEAQAVATRQQQYRQRLRELAEQIQQNQHRIEQEEAILQRWRSLATQQTELEEVRREAERLQRVKDTIERIELELQQLKAESGHEGPWEQLRTVLQQQHEAAQREEQLTAEQLNQLESFRAQVTGRQRWRVGLGIAGVALILTGVSLIFISGLLGGIMAGLGVATILIALLWRSPSLREIEHQHLQQQHERARQQVLQVQRQLDKCEALLNRRAGLLQAHDPDELHDQLQTLARRELALATELQQDPMAQQLLARHAEEWLQREQQLKALQQAREQMVQEKLRIEGALQTLHLEHDPEELRLQLQSLEEQDAYLQKRVELLQMTRELLKEANRRYLSDLGSMLQPRIAAYLPALTCGRYTKVQLGDGLLFQVYHPEADDWLDAEPREVGWSAGTLDQIYFACRLGLSDALTGDRRVPLLLDDPFLAFDEARLLAAMELLTRIAQYMQVLLFTCRLPDPVPPGATLIRLPLPPMSAGQVGLPYNTR